MNNDIPDGADPKFDHIGIAVENIETFTEIYENLGLVRGNHETIVNQDVEIQFFQTGDTHIELIAPISEKSPVAKFLKKNGPGLHHIAFNVNNINSALDHYITKGFIAIDKEPRMGAGGCLIAFLHPKSTGGVLIELRQNNR